MKQVLLAVTILAALSMTSCKKNWQCIHRYPSQPGNPSAGMVTSTVEITAKKKREAKLECKSYAGPDDTWELNAK